MQTLQGSGLPETTMGGSGFHPAIAKHFQQEAAQDAACSSAPERPPSGLGQAGTPSTSATVELGGGACHPLIAKHLQLRMLAAC